jgi:hypothetical protein
VAYTNLANCLTAGESVTLPDGRAMNKRELHLEAIRRGADSRLIAMQDARAANY